MPSESVKSEARSDGGRVAALRRRRRAAPHLEHVLVQVERVPLISRQLHAVDGRPLLPLLLLLAGRRRRRLRAEPPPRRERQAGCLGAHCRTIPPPLCGGACVGAGRW